MARLGVTRDRVRLPWGTRRDGRLRRAYRLRPRLRRAGDQRGGPARTRGVVPGYARDTQYERLVASLDMAAALGITTIVEPQNGAGRPGAVRAGPAGGRAALAADRRAAPPAGHHERPARRARRRRCARLRDDRLRVAPIKLYIDDVIEPHTAAMLAPYANRPDTVRRHLLAARRVRRVPHGAGAARAPDVHPCDGRPRDPHRARRRPGVPPRLRTARRPPPDRARGVRPSRRPRAVRRARRGRVHAAAPLRARHRGGVAGQRRPGPRALRLAVPIDPRARRGARVQLGLERRGDGSDGLALHRGHARRPATAPVRGTPTRRSTLRLRSARRRPARPTRTSPRPTAARSRPGRYADLVVLSRDLFEPGDPLAILDTRVAATIVDGEVVYRAQP